VFHGPAISDCRGSERPPRRRCGCTIDLENVDALEADLDRWFAALLKAAWRFGRPTIWTSPLPAQASRHAALPHRLAGSRRRPPPDYCREVVPNDNHPFTMTVNPAVQSTKTFTPQVPLYL
jgi:hypothetical protein